MFIQKIFHVHRPVAETRQALARPQAFRRHLEGVETAVVTADGVAQFKCDIDGDLSVRAVLIELPTPNDDEILFRSTAGNIDISGLVEFAEVHPNVTEVQLTLNYEPRTLLGRLSERCLHRIEHYLERQLRCLQACLDGVIAQTDEVIAVLPQLAR